MANLNYGRRVRVTAWGLRPRDALRAEDEARAEATFLGWRVELATLVVGGKASEATTELFAPRELRRRANYGRLWVIYAPPPWVEPALLRALANWAWQPW